MRTYSKTITACFIVLAVAGCTQKIYFRSFWVEEMPELKRSTPSYFLFDDFTISPSCDVSFLEYEPIADSAFAIWFFVLPTDSSTAGNDRFVRTFVIDRMIMLNMETGDTLANLTGPQVEIKDWRTHNIKEFNFGKVVLSNEVERITLKVEVSYIDARERQREQALEFRMYRHDGYTRVVHGRWQH